MGASDDASATRLAGRRKPRSLAGYVRPALASLLLLVVIGGVGATDAAPTSWRGRWHQDGYPIGLALELVLAALLFALWLVRRRAPQAGHPAAELRAVLFRAILVVMAAVAVAAVVNLVAHKAGGRLLKILGRRAPPRTARQHYHSPAHAQTVHIDVALYARALLALLIVAAIVAVCLVIIRRQRVWQPADIDDSDDGDEDTRLREAVESGRSALRAVDDAQAAIIACYVAMEASLARAGTVRRTADTPDELLARAVAAGMLRGPAAGRLTELFYEARFSSHALAPATKDEARQALDDIVSDLDRPPIAEAIP